MTTAPLALMESARWALRTLERMQLAVAPESALAFASELNCLRHAIDNTEPLCPVCEEGVADESGQCAECSEYDADPMVPEWVCP